MRHSKIAPLMLGLLSAVAMLSGCNVPPANQTPPVRPTPYIPTTPTQNPAPITTPNLFPSPTLIATSVPTESAPTTKPILSPEPTTQLPQSGPTFHGFGPGLLGLAITPDGKTAYVPFSLDDSLLVVDLSTFSVEDSIDVSSAGNMLVSNAAVMAPDGKRLFVSNAGTKNLMVVNIQNKAVEKVLPLSPQWGTALTISKDGKKLYVPSTDGSLYIVDTTTLAYKRVFIGGAGFGPVVPLSSNPDIVYSVGVRAKPPGNTSQPAFLALNIVNDTIEQSTILNLPPTAIVRRLIVDSNENKAYFGSIDYSISDKGTGSFNVFDLQSFRLISSTPVENGVQDFALNEKTGKAYLGGFWSGGTSPESSFIMEWDISNNSLIRKINVSLPADDRAIVFDPTDLNYLYMTEGDPFNVLRKVDISTGEEVETVQFNKADIQPYAIVRNGNIGYVVSLVTSKVIYKLDLTSGQLIGRIDMPYEHLTGWGFYQGRMYVSNGGDIVYAMDPSDGSIVDTYHIGTTLKTIFFTVFGDKMAALDFDTAMIAKRLLVFDAKTMTLLNSVDLPPDSYGDRVIVSPDGSKLYITCGPPSGSGTTTITVFDSATLKAINTIKITPTRPITDGGTNSADAEFDEAKRIVYIIGHASIYELDMDTDKLLGILDAIDIFGGPGNARWTPTGLSGIVLSPTKDKLFIVSTDAHSVFTYDLVKSAWSTQVINLRGYFVTHAITSPDKRYLYTANGRTDSITQVDLSSGKIVRIIGLQNN